MGKRQHQKDKMYITCAEYTHFYGGKKAEIPKSNFRRLPFDHCSLSLQPFEYPVCTPDGTIFDLLNIVPWIKKYGTHPNTGETPVAATSEMPKQKRNAFTLYFPDTVSHAVASSWLSLCTVSVFKGTEKGNFVY